MKSLRIMTGRCDVEEWIAAVDVGPSRGLVLGGDQTDAAWLRLPEADPFLIVRLIYANDNSEAKILELYDGRDGDWVRLDSALEAGHGDLLLLHAASMGLEVEEKLSNTDGIIGIGDAIPFPADRGSYALANWCCRMRGIISSIDLCVCRRRQPNNGMQRTRN